MISAAPLEALFTALQHALALALAITGGSAVGLPIKRRIIRKWSRSPRTTRVIPT